MNSEAERRKYGYLEGWVSIVVNLIIFLVKLFIGIAINSIAIIANGIHTLSDVITSMVVIFGFKMSARPADRQHPFGHGRSEFIATLVMAILLAFTGVELAKTSFARVMNPQVVKGTFTVVYVVLFTAVLKEVLAQFSFFLGKRINSDALYADGWHHRSDALISAMVAVGVIASRYGYYRLDGILGIFVSLTLIWLGFTLIKKTSSTLLGEAPRKELNKDILGTASSVAGVKGVHGIMIHNYGDKNSISLHIEVDRNISLNEAHAIADEVESKVEEKIRASAVVHVDVISRGKISR